MSVRYVENCGACGSDRLQMVLDLGSSPATCVMQPVGPRSAETHYPLELLRCWDCTLVQLSVALDPDTMFPATYPYSSRNSRALHANFEDLAAAADCWLETGDLVVDIGANDGTLLSKFPESCGRVAVEPTRQISYWKVEGGAGYRQPFSDALVDRILADHGPAKVITACNVLAHVDDLNDVLRGIARLLAPDGVLIAENHDLGSVVDGGQWDTVYHEHLRFYSPYSFASSLARHDLGVLSWQPVPTHGGSFRMFAGHGTGGAEPTVERTYDFPGLQYQAQEARRAIRLALSQPAWGIGATARATTVINYCGLDEEDVPYVVEVVGSDKIGHFIPGTRIPVIDESPLFQPSPPMRTILFSWHLADQVVPGLRARGYEGEITVPLPQLAYR